MGNIYLEPISHTYINKKTDTKYTSVTTILGKFKEKFEADKIASAMAKRDNRKKEDILQEWADISKKATDFGTFIVHNPIEEFIIKKGFFFPKDNETKEVIKAFTDLNVLTGENNYAEYILSLEEYKIAGTSDLIIDYPEHFDVFDYKSNKKITYDTEYNKWFKEPLNHLVECSYSSYSLQLSFYAYMYSLETGKKVGKLSLLWWNRESKKFERIPIPYMKYEVLEVLNWLKFNQ